jgi:FemAB-related protein (PEP-CTERM system-associated)
VKVSIWNSLEAAGSIKIQDWASFVESHSEGHVFHSPRWQKILSQAYPGPAFHLAAEGDGGIRGILSLYPVRGLFGGKDLYSLPHTAYGGLLAENKEAAQALANAATDLAKQTGSGLVHLRNTAPNELDLPTTDLHVRFIKALATDDESCLESIPRKSRWTVRQGITKHELSWEISRDWEALWHLHAANLHRLGTPVFSRRYFQAIAESLGDDCDILFVKYRGQRVCGVMNFYYKDVCNPYFSGSLSEFNFTGANPYMYWALMCHALKRGCKRYDFGKSRRGTGPASFKLNLGFEPETLPYQFIFNKTQTLPNLNPSNPKLKFFIETWAKQPLALSKVIGPWVNRFLP